MAIKVRGGLKKDFDPNKLTNRELAIVLDTGEAYFCLSPGNVKRLATKEDLEEILNASPEALQALEQLIADLELNPSQITNILNNIANLQANKLDKANIANNDVTTVAGLAWDARRGKAIRDDVTTLSNNFTDKTNKKYNAKLKNINNRPYISYEEVL